MVGGVAYCMVSQEKMKYVYIMGNIFVNTQSIFLDSGTKV